MNAGLFSEHRMLCLACLGAVLALGCRETDSELGARTRGDAKVGGDVVSTVDGVAITLGDVQRFVSDSGLTPRDALRRLQSEALLAAEAAHRGYGDDPAVAHLSHQAWVQALLGQRIESLRATDAEIAAEYEKQSERYKVPELREAKHVLYRLREPVTPEQDQEARAFIEAARQELLDAIDVGPVLARYRARAGTGMPIVVEELPPVPSNGPFVAPFMQAVFAMPSVGVVPSAVRTKFGWHAIVVTSITPAKTVPLSEAAQELRKEIELDKHERALKALLEDLRHDIPIVEDAHARKAMADLEI